MSDEAYGRRSFLQRLSFLGGGVLLFGPACNSKGTPVPPPRKVVGPGLAALPRTSAHHTFTDEDYGIMSAVVDRLLPRDQDPGALDANVPEYVDRTLQTPELHKLREDVEDGLAVLEKRAHGTFGQSFPQLSADQKDQLLGEFMSAKKGSGEQQFFANMMQLTLEGFLGDPAYGGNKDHIGWALVGFDTWTPADYHPDQGLVPLKAGG